MAWWRVARYTDPMRNMEDGPLSATHPEALFAGAPPWLVPDAPLPAIRRIAVVAPHPDDFDVIAITLRRFQRASARIAVAVLSSGSSGVEDEFVSDPTPDAKRRLREDEQRASCAFFGLPAEQLTFLRLAEEDGHLALTSQNTDAIDAFLVRWQPGIVFLPHGNDSNRAHRRTHAMVVSALARQQSGAALMLNRDPKTIAMREDVYVLFAEDEAGWKRELLRHHASQQRRNLRTRGIGFDERILAGNARIASAAGRHGCFAEAFELRTAGGPS